jgi:hypothetical protein
MAETASADPLSTMLFGMALQSMKSFQVINPDSASAQGHEHTKPQVKPVQKK